MQEAAGSRTAGRSYGWLVLLQTAPEPRLMATKTRKRSDTDSHHAAPIRFVPVVLSWLRCRIQRTDDRLTVATGGAYWYERHSERRCMRKVALFAFSGDPASFAHAMLTAMDMKDRSWEVKVVVEGEATKLLSLLRNETKPFADIYRRFRDRGFVDCVCRACATRNGVVPVVIEENLKLGGDMAGHPSMAAYMEQGYEVVTL
jgi:hypothetical protein